MRRAHDRRGPAGRAALAWDGGVSGRNRPTSWETALFLFYAHPQFRIQGWHDTEAMPNSHHRRSGMLRARGWPGHRVCSLTSGFLARPRPNPDGRRQSRWGGVGSMKAAFPGNRSVPYSLLNVQKKCELQGQGEMNLRNPSARRVVRFSAKPLPDIVTLSPP